MTDKELEKRIKEIYRRATEEMTDKMESYLDQFVKDIDVMSAKVEAGEISERYFKKWKRDQILLYDQWEKTREKLSDVLFDADNVARDLIKGHLPTVLADGINRTFYDIEKIKEVGDMGISFNLTNEQAVKRLIEKQPRLLPVLNEESKTARLIREGKIKRWNQQHITSEITQGIIQGEPMQKIAQRMQNVTGMNYRSAIRNARTATGGAYNAGRMEGMKQAEEKGVKMLKRWSAVFDDKTRDDHRILDGVTIPLDEMFEVDGYELEYPRDPNGDPCQVYNCRCRLVSVPAIVADKFDEIFDKEDMTTTGGISYDDWKKGKLPDDETQTETRSSTTELPVPASEQVIDKKEDSEKPSDFVAEKNADVPERFEDKIPEIEKMTPADIKKSLIDDDSYIYSDKYQKMTTERRELFDKEKELSENIKTLEKELESESTVKPRNEWTEEDKFYYDIMREKPTDYTDRGYEIQDELKEMRKERRDVESRASDLHDRIDLVNRNEYIHQVTEWEKEEHPFVKVDGDKEYQGFTTTMSIAQFDEDLKNGIGFIAEMSPDEYIDRIAMEIFHNTREASVNCDFENVKKYAKMIANGTKFDMGYLDYEKGGQEGRHRAIAARLLGIKKIPVYIRGR